MEFVQLPSSLALNQLSEEDRKLVAKLKQTYPAHLLDSVFCKSFPSLVCASVGYLQCWTIQLT